jgi:proteasome lid subunit RPN8/RPN11
MQLSADHLHAIIRHARSSPDEVCGVLIGQRMLVLRVDDVLPARNIHLQPHSQYLVDAATLLHADEQAQATGREIVGFYHSHPLGAAVPSPHDRRNAWPSYVYLIVALADGMPYVCAWVSGKDRRLRPEGIVVARG